ncbi:synaptonemal complex protein 1 isoform X2 [Osmerus eperlanus]|uniref:synaptonemal complex protein 1 isoform X2 n=1 Tax=Osmerus eperlanus TaxID=29151 RepID=UPI002E112048
MERDKCFHFKLMVPPRVNPGQISAVKPQESVDDFGVMNTAQQGYSKQFDKETHFTIPITNMGSTKPKADVSKITFVSPVEKVETKGTSGKLYSKLFDEVEKIKCWKVQVDSETVQRERKLQENKRTIETQRKAIQDLQFGNESLSIKLEEQISENEDLRNKNNATRNLCNILKDTFQRSADKMHLFESEREETQQLFMENRENIQRMIAAFESLRLQAQFDRCEMQKVKEGLLQFDNLKEKFGEEINTKEQEAEQLQAALKEKEKELQAILLHLQEAQESCQHLQQAAQLHQDVLHSSHQERQALSEKLRNAEELLKESEENRKAISNALELNKEETAQIVLQKDASLEELHQTRAAQEGQLAQAQATMQELQTCLARETERAQELEVKMVSVSEELQENRIRAGEINKQNEEKDGQIQVLEEELDVKSKSIESLREKIEAADRQATLLSSELAGKRDQVQRYQTKVQILETEKTLLEKALQEAEKAHSDLRNKTQAQTQEMEEQLSVAMTINKRSTKEIEQLQGDVAQQEVKYDKLLVSFNELQLEKKTVQEQAENKCSQAKTLEARLKESEARGTEISKEIEALEDQNHQLREEVSSLSTRLEEQGQGAENLQKKLDESCGGLQVEISRKEKHIRAMETKLSSLKTKLDTKNKHQEEYQKEAKMLKKQIAKDAERSCQLESEINQLKETAESLQKSSREKHQELLDEVAAKSSSEAELQKEVQDLKLTAGEAVRSREDAEIKCQHKIADMVALMEKHKNQYDKMLEAKDVELKEKKRSVVEADAGRTASPQELEQSKIENDRLKNHLDQETKEGEKLMQKIAELKEELASVKTNPSNLVPKTLSKQLSDPASASEGRCWDTPDRLSIKRNGFDFSKTKQKTPSQSAGKIQASTPAVRETKSGDLQTPSWSYGTRVGETPRIKSYRIRTPPSTQKAGPWSQTTLELDPKSDSSEHADLLSFAVVEPLQGLQQGASSAHWSKVHVFKKNQSPAVQKSPGNALKLAAMKRMRDAGWTAVTGSHKKKKAAEKIFA